MFIPTSTSELCPAQMLSAIFPKREWTSDVVSTADSFKHWDTCMDNRTCRIIALIGICLGGLILLWIISSIFSCLCCGGSCSRSVFCCCCNCGGRSNNNRSRLRLLLMLPPPQRQNTTRKNGNTGWMNFSRSGSQRTPLTPRQQEEHQQTYQYQPPSSMSPSYPGYKKETGYGYVRDVDDESIMTDAPSAAEYYSRNPAPSANPFSPINHNANSNNNYRGQNTYF